MLVATLLRDPATRGISMLEARSMFGCMCSTESRLDPGISFCECVYILVGLGWMFSDFVVVVICMYLRFTSDVVLLETWSSTQ